MSEPALFLDRDGTLVEPRHYPRLPEELILYAGIGDRLRRLQAADFRLVVVTNQAGIAHGYFDAAALDRMHAHLAAELTGFGVHLDGIYHCPHHPEGVVPELTTHCECRKPQPGMILRAATDLDIDLERSWFIGDILDDVEAGNRAGCRTVLVDLSTESDPIDPIRRPDYIARDTAHALAIVTQVEHLDGEDRDVDLSYRPPSWTAMTPDPDFHATRELRDGETR